MSKKDNPLKSFAKKFLSAPDKDQKLMYEGLKKTAEREKNCRKSTPSRSQTQQSK